MKARAVAANETLGLPPERVADTVAVLYGTPDVVRAARSVELVEGLKREVDKMESRVRNMMEQDPYFAENEDEGVQIIYGKSGSSLRGIFRSHFPKDEESNDDISA